LQVKLFLVQHGDALAKDINPDRPLSDMGKSNVERVARSLAEHIEASRVIHSGKARARQTAEILARFIGNQPSVDVFNSINPNDPVEAFAQLVDDWSEDLLVVGHLPFMSKLVSLLLTGSEEQAVVSYSPGSIVCLESTGDGGWQLLWMVRPELLN
jgi:phosphohistidine phosphatase